MLKSFMICCKIPMTCTGSYEPAQDPVGELMFLVTTAFCMRSDVQVTVGLRCASKICHVCSYVDLLFYLLSEE